MLERYFASWVTADCISYETKTGTVCLGLPSFFFCECIKHKTLQRTAYVRMADLVGDYTLYLQVFIDISPE